MPESTRSTEPSPATGQDKAPPGVAGIDESQPWRTADMQQAMERWDSAAEAGFDPYNHVGTQVTRSRVA